MQYKKTRKTSWWLIFLFIPLLVACSPVTPQLLSLAVYVGEVLIQTVAGQTIEVVFDKIISYISPHVQIEPDPENPLRGRSKIDLTYKIETPNCTNSYTAKQPEMMRKSIEDDWEEIPEVQEKIKLFFSKGCF